MMNRVFSLAAAAALIALVTHAANLENTLRERITASLEARLAVEAKGIQNCENKCDKAFNRLAYQVSATDGRRTYEFQACVQGCNQCSKDLASGAAPDNCFRSCKDFDWKSQGIVKGVIEPDKACLGGCIIQTCQAICSNGTTDNNITPQNKQYFWPNGGCSIKTADYSQNLEYVPFNSPNTGQGGSQQSAACCANSLSLCQYVGDTNSVNYAQLVQNTANICSSFVPTGTVPDLCTWFENPQNCGTI